MSTDLTRETVKSGRRVNYYRYCLPGTIRPVGAVKRLDNGMYRATGYPMNGQPPGPERNARLGTVATRSAAELLLDGWAGPVPARACSACHGTCHWHDDAWVCDDCGDEWYADHDPILYGDPS